MSPIGDSVGDLSATDHFMTLVFYLILGWALVLLLTMALRVIVRGVSVGWHEGEAEVFGKKPKREGE